MSKQFVPLFDRIRIDEQSDMSMEDKVRQRRISKSRPSTALSLLYTALSKILKRNTGAFDSIISNQLQVFERSINQNGQKYRVRNAMNSLRMIKAQLESELKTIQESLSALKDVQDYLEILEENPEYGSGKKKGTQGEG